MGAVREEMGREAASLGPRLRLCIRLVRRGRGVIRGGKCLRRRRRSRVRY